MRQRASSLDDGARRTTRRPAYDISRTADACDSGLPDLDTCSIEFDQPKERDAIAASAAGALERARRADVFSEAWSRGKWLLGLLVLQSSSSFVLDHYQKLLQDHLVVTLFLTMLVGAGGNAGNQSAIKVIRGLATGKIQTTPAAIRKSMAQQAAVGLLLGGALSVGGFLRVYITNGDVVNAAAISASLLAIVMASVVIGSGLPFALARLGLDPANAGTSIQVIMDVLGVAITCVTCDFVLNSFAASLG